MSPSQKLRATTWLSIIALAAYRAAEHSDRLQDLENLRQVITQQGKVVDYFVVRTIRNGIDLASRNAPISELQGLGQDFVIAAILASSSEFRVRFLEEINARFSSGGPFVTLEHALSHADHINLAELTK